MERISHDKIAEAKKKLRKVLSFQELKRILKRKDLTKAQYKQYLNNIERFVFMILDAFVNRNKEKL